MVAGIDEMGEGWADKSAVLGVVEEIPGVPGSLLLGSGQAEAGLLEVQAMVWRRVRPNQAAAASLAADPRPGGGTAVYLGVHGGSEWEASLLSSYLNPMPNPEYYTPDSFVK